MANHKPNHTAELYANLSGSEIVRERSKFSKTFDLGCGRRQAVIYPTAVHYQGSDGAWRDIDNTLEEVSVNGRRMMRTHDNDMRMEFPVNADGGSLASFSDREGHTFSWRFEHADSDHKPAAHVLDGAGVKQRKRRPDLNKQDGRMHPDKYQSELFYEDVLPGVSVRYSLMGHALKEDIIVQNEQALANATLLLPDTYCYEVVGERVLKVCDKETKDILFSVNAPVVYDAEGAAFGATVRLTTCDGYTRLEYVLEAENPAYPITIDPVVTSEVDATHIHDTFIWESDPNSVLYNHHMTRCGFHDGGEAITLIKIDNLLNLKVSDTITSALLRMSAKSGTESSSEYVGCYPITGYWDEEDATWNNVMNGSANIISNDMLAYIKSTNSTYCYFDITSLYRTWYKLNANGGDQNYGVALRIPAQDMGSSEYVEWIAAKYESDYAARIVVNYVSHAGRKNWWHYESMSAGRAGAAYVDIYNGNMVFEHPDGSTTGSRMPVAISHVYNSCLSASNDCFCGRGWRTNMHQSVRKETIGEDEYYIWTDGDATEHYFLITGQSSPYEDSEGMNLELTVSSGTLTITDKADLKLAFPEPTGTTEKSLTSITDACNNSATLAYNADGSINTITDGADRIIRFSYTSGKLATLTIPGCPVLTYSYNSAGDLVSVKYSDLGTTKGTTYTYDTNGSTSVGLLTSAKNHDGMEVVLAYEARSSFNSAYITGSVEQGRRVLNMATQNASVYGAKLAFDYQHMTTKITAVDAAVEGEDKTLTYQFNDAGNVICSYDEAGYAQCSTFSASVANQKSTQSVVRKAVVNLLPNIDFSTGWTVTKGSSSDTVAKNTSTRCLNMPSVKFSTNSTNETKYSMSVNIPTAGVYTFSAYVKTAQTFTSGGLFLRVTGTGTTASRIITAPTDALNSDSSASGWERLFMTVTLPAGAVTVQFVCSGSAVAYFACPQLEAGRIPNNVNLLMNGDFSRIASDNKFPADWSISAGIDTTNAASGVVLHNAAGMPDFLPGNAVQIVSACNVEKSSHCQSVYVQGKKGDVFIIGGWVKATSVASAGSTEHFRACIETRFAGSSGGSYSDWEYHEFPTQRVGWTFCQWAVVAPKDYYEIRIGIQYAHNFGTAMFSNIFVYREEYGKSFAYDENKNVTSVATLSTQQSAIEYDSEDNVTSYRRPGAASTVKYTMNYGSSSSERKKHLLRSATTPMGVKQSYEYDSHGNCTMAKNQKTTSGIHIQADTVYGTSKENFPTLTRDARGIETSSTYNETTGTLTSATDPNGKTVNYTYDEAKRVETVKFTDSDGKVYKNSYNYDNASGECTDRIVSVTHNTDTTSGDGSKNVTYNFAYDALNRKTAVSVGSTVLSTNEYVNNRSGLLKAVHYGNGGKVAYTYDGYNRLTGVSHDSDASPRYAYEYGANGSASIVHDHNLDRTFQTETDLSGRPVGTQLRNAGSNHSIYRTQMAYDTQNRLTRFSEALYSSDHKTEFTYDNDDRVTQITYDGSSTNKVTYSYDELNRVTTRGAGASTATFSYLAGRSGDANSTTAMISAIAHKVGASTVMGLSYTYDNRGNILTETRGGLITNYHYDDVGQLVRVDDPHESATWVYAYDCGGNITSKKKYAYTTGTPSGTYTEAGYTYGDSAWLDKLTKYGSTSISYDSIGNPTAVGNVSYSWRAGRQLKQISGGNGTLTFDYDHNGQRVRKTHVSDAGTIVTDYDLHGKRVTNAYVYNSNTFTDLAYMHFFYDAQGRPAAMDYDGVIYTYIYNLQGDIIGILDSAGSLVVEYKYDAWGRLLSTTGSKASTVGKYNPFRYRGYIYDDETGLYYLRSRYYNPEWGRFINADTLLGKVGALGSHNLFAYCGNNPVVKVDPDGRLAKSLAGVGGLIGGLPGVIIGGIIGCGLIFAMNPPSISLPKINTKMQVRSEEELKTALVNASAKSVDGRDPTYRTESYYLAYIINIPFVFGGEEVTWGTLEYINEPLTLQEAQIILGAEVLVNSVMKERDIDIVTWGIYTDMNGSALDLSVSTGGSVEPENHFGESKHWGDYYWHYHAFKEKHGPHIWFGTVMYNY